MACANHIILQHLYVRIRKQVLFEDVGNFRELWFLKAAISALVLPMQSSPFYHYPKDKINLVTPSV